MKKWLAYSVLGTLVLGGLLVAAFHSPIWYDDTGHFLVAREVARGHGMCYPIEPMAIGSVAAHADGARCIPDSPFITMGPVQAYPLGGWLAIFGQTMIVGRIFMVLLSLLTLSAFFVVARRLTNSSKALIPIGIMVLNIQFLTYGAEVLGEVPMMGFVLTGLGCFLNWDKDSNWKWAVGGIVSWCLAVGIKEYALLPMALSLGMWWLMRLGLRDRPWKVFLLGVGLMLGLTLALIVLHGGIAGVWRHLAERQSYGSEFLAFNVGLSFKFLLLKPLFWLGTGAMILKWRVKRRSEEALTLSVQAAWLMFYLLSAGYDRFGFLLLFLPAIYVAEFIPYLWKEAGRKAKRAWLWRMGLVLLGFVLFSQQTWWVFGKRILDPLSVNEIERTASEHVSHMNADFVITADQQAALFLEKLHQPYRLVSIVPSQGRVLKSPHPDFFIGKGELFLAGPYAFTEYAGAIDWKVLIPLDSVGVGEEKWVIFGPR